MRIAILGGGVGSMTAAYWLTGGPNPHQDNDVTVYQMGWRLGGKGASGRNGAEANRIEEHGLHVWMGSYANAFRMMRNVYAELGRPPGAPLATWEDAFKPQSVITLMQETADGSGWVLPEWILTFPIKPGTPGDQTAFDPPCAYVTGILGWAKQRLDELITGRNDPCGSSHSGGEHHPSLALLHDALDKAHGHSIWPEAHGPSHHLLLRGALEVVQALLETAFAIPDPCIGLQRVLLLLDLAVATVRGIVTDLCGKRWEAIDDLEWRTWLRHHGLDERSAWSTPTRALYDLLFAYVDGVKGEQSANLAAGTATQAAMRFVLDYYDSIFLKMQAGMGDTIFAPLYLVLKKRGVKFKFFYRLRDVVPSEDGLTIDELHFGVQATVLGEEYDPLIDVNDLPCWPSLPRFEQLQEGDRLRDAGIDLEDYDAPWNDVDRVVLRRQTDVDLVVFGLSLGAVPLVCRRLLEQKETWRQMFEHVKTVRTQAFQFWLSRNIADLGWPPALDGTCFGERAVLSAFVEPLDTWADMSQLIPREQWLVPTKNISYFCGPLNEASSNEDATQQVVAAAHAYLSGQDVRTVWKYAATGEGTFKFHWLCVNEPWRAVADEERFRRQYFRANVQPTERYVLSLAGSTKYRLDPADNGYQNLCLAGDWVRNGFALGCVESAVLGAMKGVQPHCPGMSIVETKYE